MLKPLPSQTSYPVSDQASKLISTLDSPVQVNVLRKECPEVLDLLARNWNDTEQLRRTFDSLLFGPRRSGLPLSFDALLEIAGLQQFAHMQSQRRGARCVWENSLESTY
ncbi:MAG: hypothetical protein JF606_16980 [Burkholderiales bacterium]|jgi:hypothetical protein|nr:hypothetical protein [Burkholderiales bacterium]